MYWWARRLARKGEVEEQREEQELGKCAAYSIGCRECGAKGKAAKSIEEEAVKWKSGGNRVEIRPLQIDAVRKRQPHFAFFS